MHDLLVTGLQVRVSAREVIEAALVLVKGLGGVGVAIAGPAAQFGLLAAFE